MDKVFRIGIDRLSLYNFQIKKMCDGLVFSSSNEEFKQETTHVKDELFSLDTSVRVFKTGEVREFRTLTFNPNKIMYGNNIGNSRSNELRIAIINLKVILESKGIEIDFTEAKINSIEINMNIQADFKDYWEVFLLFFTQKTNSKTTARNTENTKLSEKLKSESFFYKNSSMKIRVYDKTAEVNDPKILSTQITRVEYMFERQTYAYFLKKLGHTNTLDELIKNIQLIDYMFFSYIKKDFLKKSVAYINDNIKRVLEVQYLAFKSSNRLARDTNRKQKRNVYRHLEDYWIFDNSFVVEVVKKHDKKSFYREKKRVKTILKKHNNLEKFNFLVEHFFSTLIAFSVEDEELLQSIKNLDTTKEKGALPK